MGGVCPYLDDLIANRTTPPVWATVTNFKCNYLEPAIEASEGGGSERGGSGTPQGTPRLSAMPREAQHARFIPGVGGRWRIAKTFFPTSHAIPKVHTRLAL